MVECLGDCSLADTPTTFSEIDWFEERYEYIYGGIGIKTETNY